MDFAIFYLCGCVPLKSRNSKKISQNIKTSIPQQILNFEFFGIFCVLKKIQHKKTICPLDKGVNTMANQLLFELFSNENVVPAVVGNNTNDKINYCTIGCCSGLFEYYLPELGFQSSVSCEIDPLRAHFYTEMHDGTHMVCKSVADPDAKVEIIDWCKKTNVQLLIYTLPCQGSSTLAGKNARKKNKDPRNWLFEDVFDIAEQVKPKWFIGENVIGYYKNKKRGKTSEQIMRKRAKRIGYNVKFVTLDASDYGTAQKRKRRYMLAYLGNKKWNVPAPTTPKPKTIRDAIGHLPSLEAGQDSGILYHKAPNVRADLVELVRHTPTGCNIKNNPAPFNIAYKKDGKTPLKYKFAGVFERSGWDEPAHTITTGSASIMATFGIHPGNFVGYDENGLPLYDNARPRTVLEQILLSGLPETFRFPDDMSETQMRIALGEIALPLMLKMFIENRPTD